MRLRIFCAGLLLCAAAISTYTQPVPVRHREVVQRRGAEAPDRDEVRAMRALDAARGSSPQLRGFLVRMPKGADLHMHLSGAVYAETFLEDAAHDNLCLDPREHKLVKNIGTTRSLPPQPVCAEGEVRASEVFRNQELYDAMIDSFSMRAFVPSAGMSGHDHFFGTFSRFGGLSQDHLGEWLDEVATRAAAQNEQYLEIMETPDLSRALKIAAQVSWPESPVTTGDFRQDTTGTSTGELSALRQKLLAGGLAEAVRENREQLSAALQRRREIEHCGTAAATPACTVEIRFLYQVLRAQTPAEVFATTLLGFELGTADPDVVGVNLVQPEDAYLAMSEYTRQMRMLAFLRPLYPKVHLSLHAGELTQGLVPPEGLRFHVREAVEIAHAERIGHGVDVMYEDNPQKLLQELADEHVMVEINLTSNDVILDVSTNRHSLPAYRAGHVPVALSTDDEGVSRIDLTHEYARAVLDFSLGYLDLKRMARTSLEHSFLPGDDLWQTPDSFKGITPACSGQSAGSESPSARCAEFLHGNVKAAQQWELERRFRVFERSFP